MIEPSLESEITGRPNERWFVGLFRRDWAVCLFLAIVGFVVRVPALQGEAVWDDDYLIRTNPFIKSPILILEAFRHYLFQDTYSAHYRPVQNISYSADYFFWNNNFYGFHLTSILCHVASGVLLYFLTRKLIFLLYMRLAGSAANPAQQNQLKASLLALFVALLWVVHPVHSAAVDYVSGRADSLAFLFSCSAWLLFLKAREFADRRLRFVVLGLAWFSALLALCSRESGCIWVAIFLLYLFAFEPSMKRRQKWIVAAFCAALLGAYCGLRALPGPPSLPSSSSDFTPPALRIVLMLRSLGDYGRLLIYPGNLHMERTVYNPKAFQSEPGRWNAIEHEYLSILGLFILTVLILSCLRRGPGQRLRIFGVAWFFVAYLPLSNLISLNATVAEHWLYLPSVGFLIFLAGCAIDLRPQWQRASVAFACMAVLGLGARSAIRSGDWISNETFARSTISSGGATIRIILLLGQAYAKRGDYVAAEHLLRKALELFPNYPTTRNNLADALAHEGKEKEAEALFRDGAQAAVEDCKEYPRTWIAALNLSQLRYRQHDTADAIAVLEKARQNYPATWELIGAESELLREENKIDQALDLIRPFAQNNWWHYRAWIGLGHLLAQKGDAAGAETALRHASWLDIHETSALNLIALMRIRQNRLTEACQTQRRAVSRQPDEPRQYILLSDILSRMGKGEEARTALAHVSRLRTLADSKPAGN
jgi:protein O-mannosyl-transferase